MNNIDYAKWEFLPAVEFEGRRILAWRNGNGAEVIEDLVVAWLLGLADLHSIRRTIRSYRDDLGEVSEHDCTRAGKTSAGFFLTEAQAFFLAGKSRGRPGMAGGLAAVSVIDELLAKLIAVRDYAAKERGFSGSGMVAA